MPDERDTRKNAISSVECVLKEIEGVEAAIGNYDASKPDHLYEALNKYISSLKSLHAAGVGLQQTEGIPYYEVPLELLQHLDEGGNPDTFVVNTVKSTLRSSEDAKRTIGQLKTLRSNVEGANEH